MGFPGSSDGKETVCDAGDPSLIPGPGRSLEERNDNPLPHSCLEDFMDRPWGHKESDTTEQLTQQRIYIYIYTYTYMCVRVYIYSRKSVQIMFCQKTESG